MDALIKAVLAFRDERDWRQFHNPKIWPFPSAWRQPNCSSPSSGRGPDEIAAFLAEEGNRRRVGEEMADVLILLVSMANAVGIDLMEAARAKLAVNAASIRWSVRGQCEEVRCAGVVIAQPPASCCSA